MEIPLDHYWRELKIEYEGEIYFVRDNGAIYRKRRLNRNKRPLDETWTFGVRNRRNGYMYIGRIKVHRIVAVAFLGPPPSKQHVVDHIDRDRTNNSIENLRWITNLDNLIRHPGVRKRIINAYGSLDKFFEDPNNSSNELEPPFAWLKLVSKEEAQKSREKLQKWTESDRFVKRGVLSNRVHGNLQSIPPPRPPLPIPEKQSLTSITIQRR